MIKEVSKLFIGSSSESLDIAEEIKTQLDNYHNDGDFEFSLESTVWDKCEELDEADISSFMQRFENVLKNYDFGLFIISKDDVLLSRDAVFNATRDNVWFEAGMFLGRKGKENVFLFLNRNDFDTLKMPSDLQGILFSGVKWDSKILDLYRSKNILFNKSDSCNKDIRNRVKDKMEREINAYCKKLHKSIRIRLKKNEESEVADLIKGRDRCYIIGKKLIERAETRLYTTISFRKSLTQDDEKERLMQETLIKKLSEATSIKTELTFTRYFNTNHKKINEQYDTFERILKELNITKIEDYLRKISFDYLELIISDNSVLIVLPNFFKTHRQKWGRVEFGLLIENNEFLSDRVEAWLYNRIYKEK